MSRDDRRQPHDYRCPECDGWSELVFRGLQVIDIEVHHFATCCFEGQR